MVPDVREITSRSELRLFDGKRQVAEFGDNEILELRCHKSVSTIDFLECELSTTNEDGLAEIRPRRVV
jgi:hypothetical protein